MASQLKIDDLRAELSKRGLSTAGIKPTLVKRLESIISKENSSQSPDSNCDSRSRKRQNDCTDGDSVDGEKIRAVDKLRSLNVKQLREEATLRGVSTSGSKKELLDRLCEDSKADSSDIIEAKEEEDTKETKKEKLVTATKKGSAVLDQWLPDHIKSGYHVLQRNNEIYDAMLNQTNIGDNNNKFFVLQVLESDDGGRYMVYNRWGRVGVKGQDKLYAPHTLAESAIREFEQKFYAKTKNLWSERAEFVFHPKCYAWLEMDYDKTEKETAVPESKNKVKHKPKKTQLDARVAKFISLICNVSMMKQQMMEIGYNAEKLPLSKLSRSTILKGYEVLKRVADVIGQSEIDRTKLVDLSGEFYTIIPHDFGFRKMSEFVIDTPQKLKNKLEMVEALGEIEHATKLLKDDVGMQDDPLFAHYQRLHCELTPVEADSEEFNMIAKYMKNTHANTHSISKYTVDIAQIFRTSREGEVNRFEKFSNTKNRMLLWHGSRLTNWAGILSQGLRIAPPEAPVSGYLFGKGVYFADMFSKSANYCDYYVGVLLLCEVALGDMAELLYGKYDADKLPHGKLSTKGVGTTAPDPLEVQTLEDGVIVPLGKPKQQMSTKASLFYNEYIVYNVDQIRMRYVVRVNFNYKR